jgi:uncharacterized protein DUF3575
MRAVAAVVVVLAAASSASAEPERLENQVQADVGLAVVGLGIEVPIADHVALMAEAQIFGTYFLPWFDRGDDAKGLGAQVRATWFQRTSGHGLYVMGYARMDAVRNARDMLEADGIGTSAGAVVGWSFRLTNRLDLRVGAGVQYIYMRSNTSGTLLGASTVFPTIDGVFGWRL